MEDNSDIIFYEDSTAQVVVAESDNSSQKSGEKWKLMIVDDEQEIHSVTRMVLNRFSYEGKSLEFVSAYSALEAKKLILENPDTALILLDVVMEEDHSGLEFVKYIRDELKNKLVRIILRTGQAGQAPEEKVIIDYDINDYKEKTELTSQKLFSTVVSSLRSYQDLSTIDSSRKGLKRIIDSFAGIFQQQSLRDFTSSVLKQLSVILREKKDTLVSNISSFAAIKDKSRFYIISSIGIFTEYIDVNVQDVVSPYTLEKFEKAYAEKRNIYFDGHIIIYLQSRTGFETSIYIEGCKELSVLEKDLVEVFCMSITAVNEAIINSSRYDSERQQRLLSESLRELNISLTSTLDPTEVLERLLDGMSQVLTFDMALSVLKKDEYFDIFTKKGYENLSDNGLDIDSVVNEIVCGVSFSNNPIIVGDKYIDSGILTGSYSTSDMVSFLGVPIIYKESLLGVVVLQSRFPNAFDEKEKDIALTFTSQAGIAIENARLFTELNKRNNAINNLLNNAGQGFLTFSEDLLIDEEYSQECLEIFGEEIENKKLSDLIYTDEEHKKLLDFMLVKTLNEESKSKLELYIPLLPDGLNINGKFIHFEYKRIESVTSDKSKSLMAILTDITNTKSMENTMEEERKILKMVVKAVTNYNSLSKCIRDYHAFCEEGINELLSSDRQLDEIAFEIFRCIHTFKGNFSQIDMINIVNRLHEFETELTDFRKNINNVNLFELKHFISTFNLSDWLNKDIQVLKNILGENFFNKEKMLFIDQTNLLEIENQMLKCAYSNSCASLCDIRRLRFKPIKEILKPYQDYILKLSDNLDKPINPLIIDAEEIHVDLEIYQDFARSLVHVFRNAMDHGIETAYEREEYGKNEIGTISCKISKAGDYISISIADDGRGLDFNKIIDKAKNMGILPSNYTEDYLSGLIFHDEFSTNSQINKLSGRGFGLAAVKSEVEKLKGRIEVKTEQGNGTEFTFYLPYEKV